MALQYSEINFDENKDKKKKRKNVTLKNSKKPHEKIHLGQNSNNLGQHFLNNGESDDEGDLATFHAYENKEQKVDGEFPPNPQITQFPASEDEEKETDNQYTKYDPNVSSYSSNQSRSNASYYEHFVPNYTRTADPQNLSGGQNELMTKLNHILHLLEEQKDNKTSNVTEELILYMFLGVFVIFTVDSFTKVGKYTR